jgi:hypothetical protein
MTKPRTKAKFILCIENKDCDDLEKGKVYPLLADAKAMRDGFVRVIDDSGEDYLYPESYFVAVDIPSKAREALSAAS